MFGFLESATDQQRLLSEAQTLQVMLDKAYEAAELPPDAQLAVDVSFAPHAALLAIGDTPVWCSETDGDLSDAYTLLLRYAATTQPAYDAVNAFILRESE